MQLSLLVAAILLSNGSTQQAAKPQSGIPLAIVGIRVETADGRPAGEAIPRFDFRNDGAQTILALGVSYEVLLPGGQTEHHGVSMDSSAILPKDRTPESRPGGIVTLGGSPVSSEARVGEAHVTFAIFDDDTALGDEGDIAFMFEERRKRQVFWSRMDAIFQKATAAESDPAAVFALVRAGMASESDPAFRNVSGGWPDEILARMTERRMQLTHTTPLYVLETLRTTIAENKAHSDAHVQRRR